MRKIGGRRAGRIARMIRRKLIRVTTVAGSLDGILKGQLGFLNKSFEVVGIASGQEILNRTSQREGIRTINVEMKREISLLRDIKSLISLIKIFRRERPFIVHASTPKASLLSMVAAWIARTPNRIYTVTGVRFETTKGMFRTLLKTMERLTCLFATKVIPEGVPQINQSATNNTRCETHYSAHTAL